VKDEYEFVDWGEGGKVHNWRNYISEGIRRIWHTFNLEQRLELVLSAKAQAAREDWDY
jgi:hypothetical protein